MKPIRKSDKHHRSASIGAGDWRRLRVFGVVSPKPLRLVGLTNPLPNPGCTVTQPNTPHFRYRSVRRLSGQFPVQGRSQPLALFPSQPTPQPIITHLTQPPKPVTPPN
ncbi:hypothetical protein DSO57_1008684 [Entomophthora muscae]|uniref:Uncharacterized protein n=2 Tax=Entomophthora muscae TaxID=34485 RepID=A0ACC2TK80_9FUNG|nr:hypothetical protein DSO57_1000359 [Entomophthora muscae]KAJ9082006.1 hypothetical protein DSO57_1008684 [Entomophthora muscae]